MFKTDLTYKDFLGNDVTETLRFNISEDEMLDLVREDARFDGGYLSMVIEQKNYAQMMDIVRKLIVISYGELSSDGRTFRKTDERASCSLQHIVLSETNFSKRMDSLKRSLLGSSRLSSAL